MSLVYQLVITFYSHSSTHPLHAPYHTLFQHTLPTYPLNALYHTPFQHILSTPPLHALYNTPSLYLVRHRACARFVHVMVQSHDTCPPPPHTTTTTITATKPQESLHLDRKYHHSFGLQPNQWSTHWKNHTGMDHLHFVVFASDVARYFRQGDPPGSLC